MSPIAASPITNADHLCIRIMGISVLDARTRHKRYLPMLLRSFIQAPNTWIANAIERRRLSQRSLARSLCVDASRFNRWIHGEEQIPRAYLVELAHHLPPADIAFVLRLKDCEDM